MIVLDPGVKLEYSLPDDLRLPEAERPTFVGRPLTARQEMQWRKLWRRREEILAPFEGNLCDGVADEALFVVGEELMGMLLTGWRNVRAKGADVPFAVGTLADLVDAREYWLILHGLREAALPTSDDEKKLGSPSGMATASSVPAAELPAAQTVASV